MRYIIILFLCVFITAPSFANERVLNIQEVKSESGIQAWLVEDKSLPIISLQFSFLGAGSINEPLDKQGLARLLSNTLDEGAGELDSQAFQKALSDHSISLSFSGSRDNFGGRVKTLSRYQDKAFNLLATALNNPRFDARNILMRKIVAARFQH